MPLFNGLDFFFKLNDVMHNFNNPGVCENILFSIFVEDFNTEITSKMSRVELTLPLALLVLLVTEMLLMYKKIDISLNNDFCYRSV